MQFYCNNFKYGDIEYLTPEMTNYVCYASFDGAQDEEVDNAYGLEIEALRTSNRPKKRIVNTKIADVLTFDIILICKDNEGIDLKKERDIVRDMTNSDNYRKLIITDETGRMSATRYSDIDHTSTVETLDYNYSGSLGDVYFNAICTNVLTIRHCGKVRGFRFTFECDAPYAWQDVTYNVVSYQKESPFEINFDTDTDDKLNRILPTITLTAKSNEFYIVNSEGFKSRITNITPTDEIIINSENSTVKSKKVANLYNYFNKHFIWLDGNKTTQNATILFMGDIEITYSLARKVGT